MSTDTALAQQAARFAAQAIEAAAQRREEAAQAAADLRPVPQWIARAQAATLPPKVYR